MNTLQEVQYYQWVIRGSLFLASRLYSIYKFHQPGPGIFGKKTPPAAKFEIENYGEKYLYRNMILLFQVGLSPNI
jgi:hypothetical protein